VKQRDLAIAAVGAGLLLLMLTSSESEAVPTEQAGPDKQPAPPEAIEADPLPEYALTQPNVIAAIVEFTESGQSVKVKSIAIKSLTAPAPMRAYVLAALSAVPGQLKADADFVRQFEKDESRRIAALEALKDRDDAIIRATEAVVVSVVTKVNAVAGAAVALGVALLEAGRTIVAKVAGIPRRSGADQIYPLYEGPVLRRGVLFQPDLAYITRGEIELSDKVRGRWLDEAANDPWFAALPSLPKGTELRFAPRWSDWSSAVSKLKEKGIDLGTPSA